MSPLEIMQIPALFDNYIYLLRDKETETCAVVDPAEAEPVLKTLEKMGWKLDTILNTHHHADHTGGNMELKERTSCQIIGPRADHERIPGIDRALGDGETLSVGSAEATVFDIPGHTRGHISFWFPESQALFCGDTLFCLGCGRVFEGTFEQMWTSLDKLRQLPESTQVYCAHEYTLDNARFAITLEPNNEALQERLKMTEKLRQEGKSTVPASMAMERATNPFLRPESVEIQENLGLKGASPVDIFAAIRRKKDQF